MALRESIMHSLNEYRNARVRRREAFGPDLIDTIGDIGKITYKSAVDGVQRTQQSVSYKFKESLLKTAEVVDNFWSNSKVKFKSTKDFVSDIMDKVHINTSQMTHAKVDSLRDKIKQYRVGAAIGLDKLSDVLVGNDRGVETASRPEPAKVIVTEQLPEIKTRDEKKTILTPEIRAKFIEYYVRNHETAQRVFEDLDRQQNPRPKLSDYMMRSGFDAFLETVIDAPDMDELRAAMREDMAREDELKDFKDLAQQIDQNILIQDEIIKAHEERNATKQNDVIKVENTTDKTPVNMGLKNPNNTGYNPPAVTNPYNSSLYGEVPPEEPIESFEPPTLTPEDLSEFELLNDIQL